MKRLNNQSNRDREIDKKESVAMREKVVVHYYKYQRSKSGNVRMFGVNSFIFVSNLYEEQHIYAENSDTVEVSISPSRDISINVPVDKVSEKYKVLQSLEDGIKSFELTKDEYQILADKTKTDEIAFLTFNR